MEIPLVAEAWRGDNASNMMGPGKNPVPGSPTLLAPERREIP